MQSSRSRGLLGLPGWLVLAIMVGCDALGPEDPKGPGAVFVDLLSPHGPEGAAVLEITGGEGLGVVSSLSGYLWSEGSGDTLRVVMILDEPGPIQFQVRADDVGHLPSVQVVQVAGPDNGLRESLVGYEVALFPVQDRRVR